MRRGLPFEAALQRGLGGLPDSDRRLAHELAAGVLRQSDALDATLEPLLTRGLAGTDPGVLDILRLGAYQLHFLERIPPHAAVATAVALAREHAGERMTGVVNAVLRRLSRPTSRTAEPRAADDLATRFSHPVWLVNRWQERFGAERTRSLLEWNNSHPILVVQPTDGDLASLARLFDAAGIPTFPAPFNAGLVVEESRPERLPGFGEGAFYVQDAAQALVVRFARVPEGAILYDACAAPGGKTLGVAKRASVVIAGDLSRRRTPRLRENIERVRASNVRIVQADARHPPVRPVDFLLLDAPCLGTGTFARHPDARLRVQPQALQRLAGEQASLLDAAADRVRPGGVLCYATCSLEPEENVEQIDRFLARHPDFRRSPLPDDELPMTEQGDLELLPHRDGMDGAFAARLIRHAASEV